MRANQPVIDIFDVPGGGRTTQLLFGESFDVTKSEGAYSFGETACGYQGWLMSAALTQPRSPSHFVDAQATYIYARPDIKSDVRMRVPYMARLKLLKFEGEFAKIPEGYVFASHITPIPTLPARLPDYTAIAERMLGTPYLWGGRSSLGIDCSGLVQMILNASGIEAPRDSGPQSRSIGAALPEGASLRRGDLVYWRGHAGVMQNAHTLLHSTAFTMSTITEPLATTTARIKAQGNGDITAIRRV